MAAIVWARPARNQLQAIVAYIALDSTAAAARLYARILDAPKRLASFPASGSIVAEFNSPEIREIYCGSYRIVYWMRDEECRIVAVVHGARNFLRAVNRAEWEID